MAILWKKKVNGTRYEVRSAGNTRRLYTDGVFHSQYNPGRPLSGGIWDLLMLPVFFQSPRQLGRVLVLGVGGGTVIQQLKRYSNAKSIVGVELNPVHLQVARQYFGVDKSIATLYQADAVQWLHDYNGPPFDLIIEDLFGEQQGQPVRAVSPSVAWFSLLSRHLTKTGILVMNFTERNELRDCSYVAKQKFCKQFSAAYQLSLPLYENVIAVFLRQYSDSRSLRTRLLATPGLNTRRAQQQLPYRIRHL